MLLVVKATGVGSQVCRGSALDDDRDATSVEDCSAQINVSCYVRSKREGGGIWR